MKYAPIDWLQGRYFDILSEQWQRALQGSGLPTSSLSSRLRSHYPLEATSPYDSTTALNEILAYSVNPDNRNEMLTEDVVLDLMEEDKIPTPYLNTSANTAYWEQMIRIANFPTIIKVGVYETTTAAYFRSAEGATKPATVAAWDISTWNSSSYPYSPYAESWDALLDDEVTHEYKLERMAVEGWSVKTNIFTDPDVEFILDWQLGITGTIEEFYPEHVASSGDWTNYTSQLINSFSLGMTEPPPPFRTDSNPGRRSWNVLDSRGFLDYTDIPIIIT